MDEFIQWFNSSKTDTLLDPLIRADIVHLWFVTLHPFDDGNGRITRTLTDLALSQMDQQSIRLYAMSPVILNKRKSYYEILEATQKGDSNITAWFVWFLQALNESLDQTLKRIEMTLLKSKFWQAFQTWIYMRDSAKF